MTADELAMLRWVEIELAKAGYGMPLCDRFIVLTEYRRCRRSIRDGHLNR